MAYLIKGFIILFFLSWQVTNIVLACPRICECKNNSTSCEMCLYSVTFQDSLNKHHMEVCCQTNSTLLNWMKNNARKTFTQVVIKYSTACSNSSTVEIEYPQLDTYSITMTNNSITKLRINVNFSNVREINLSNNKLRFINNGLFNNFKNIRTLILHMNRITKIDENSFSGLLKLASLDLSENNITTLTNVFYPLKNLQYLNLSMNNIQFIHNNYFNNWMLQHLDISHNKLIKVTPGALQQLPNLARLLLTDNPHLGITQLDTQLLVGAGRRLQQIDASRTGLFNVPEAFTHSVRFLSLVGNEIICIRCGDLDSYPLLQSLDFSNNKITLIEEDSLGRLEMLLFLNLNRNLLLCVPRSLPDGLKYLSINENFIQNLTTPDFKDLSNLRILLLKSNQIGYIQGGIFDDLLSLEVLDLSDNPIKLLSSSTFNGPLSLRDLRLCHLNLTVPEKDGSFPLSSPESVQMLHLQSSPGLARQLLSDSAALAAFSHLQYLDLRMNNLTKIRNDLLFYLGQLKTLRLHGNNINCSKELWISDWMNYNESVFNSETCYFTTLDAKTDFIKYNCTFPETFQISESLPPVNLYSTEMINKLLRYYGYINKKIDHNFINSTNNVNNIVLNSNNLTNDEVVHNIFVVNDEIDEKKTRGKEQEINNYLKALSQKKTRNDQKKINYKLLDIEQYPTPLFPKWNEKTNDKNKNKHQREKNGQRANIPVPINESEPIKWTTNGQIIEVSAVTEAYTINPSAKLEYSSYEGANAHYVQYIGMIAVICLILVSLVLWVRFRERYKRRQLRTLSRDVEDQIEVSNISGGVLW